MENFNKKISNNFFEKPIGWNYLSQPLITNEKISKFESKKLVWIPDPVNGFVAAEIRAIKSSDQLIIVTQDGSEVYYIF